LSSTQNYLVHTTTTKLCECLSALALYAHNVPSPQSCTKPIKNECQVEAMKQLWSELVDYHDFYLHGVMTNMSEASHFYLSLLPCLVFSFSNASHLHTSVQAKWTGSKIIKYSSDAFRLCMWLSVLEELLVPLIPPTPPLPSPSKLLLLPLLCPPILGCNTGQSKKVVTRSRSQEKVDHQEVGQHQGQLICCQVCSALNCRSV
jgi:hypothetical protein